MDWLRSEDLKEEKNVTASTTMIAALPLWRRQEAGRPGPFFRGGNEVRWLRHGVRRQFTESPESRDLDADEEKNQSEVIRLISVEARALSDHFEFLMFMTRPTLRRTSALVTEWSQNCGHSAKLSC